MSVAPSLPAARRSWSMALLLLAAAFSSCSREAASRAGPPAPEAAAVRVARAEAVRAPRSQPLPGTVVAVPRARIAARVSGTVAVADFKIGQSFATGERVLQLSAGELTARVAQAEAALAQARYDHRRESTLAAQGAASADALQAAINRLHLAEATLAEARTLLDYTEIRAPFAGVVTRKFVEPGDLAAPGTPLFDFEATGRFQVEAPVPESLPSIALGAALQIQAEIGAARATLAELSPAADAASRTRLAKLNLPSNAPFASGQFVRVLWPAEENSVLLVPASAVTAFGQVERVFVVADSRAILRLVKTGARHDDRIEILAGLTPGETVVAPFPTVGLRDGQPVKIQP